MRYLGQKFLLLWVCLLPITAYSLGLGEIDVKSFLNQPLKAEITIISARPGEVDGLLVGLADRAAFTRASLSRPSHLGELKFKTIVNEEESSAKVLITTRTAVKEPVLNFLVSADWTKGRVLREFTILLDPPYLAKQIAQEAAAAAEAAQNQSSGFGIPEEQLNTETTPSQANLIVDNDPIESNTASNDGYVNESAIQDEPASSFASNATTSNQTRNNSASTRQSNSATSATGNNNVIEVVDGTTLWSVAKTIKTSDVSMSQVMLAIQRLNSGAFGNDNINNMKQGAVLRVPSAQEMQSLNQQQAYAEVLQQNGLWDDYLASIGHASASSASKGQGSSGNTETNEKADASLSVLALNEGDSEQAALKSNQDNQNINSLRKELLLSEEQTESLKVENQSLQSQITKLKEELTKRKELAGLMQVEDDSLAQMEQQLAANNEAEQEQMLTEAMKQTDELEADAQTSTKMEMETETSQAGSEDSTDNLESSTEMMSTDDAQMQDENTVAGPPVIVTDAPVIQTAPQIQTPIIVSETEGSSSDLVSDIIQAVTTNPIVQGGIAGILLLILLIVKFIKGRGTKSSKKQKDTIEDAESEDPLDTQSGIIIPSEDDDETPINIPSDPSQTVDDFEATVSGQALDLDDDDEDEFSKTAIISADDMAEVASATSEIQAVVEEEEEQDEVLDEVDVYLAYSLFDNAEELLKQKIDENPERADYRAKLLDTYFAMQNKDSFIEEAASLQNLGAASEKYWKRVQTMGYELDPNNSMFAEGQGGDVADLAIAKPEAADFDFGSDESAESDFDLSLDGDDTDFNLGAVEESNDKTELEFDLGDDFDFEANNEESSDETIIRGDQIEESGVLPDDLGGLDFDIEDDASSHEEPETAIDSDIEDADDSLEFNMDESLNLGSEDDSIIAETEFEEETVADADLNDIGIDLSESDDLEIDLGDDLEIGLDDIDEGLNDDNLDLDIPADSNDDIESENLDFSANLDDDDSEESVLDNTDYSISLDDDDGSIEINSDDDDEEILSEDNVSLDETQIMNADDLNISIEDSSDSEEISQDAEVDADSVDDDSEALDISINEEDDSEEIDLSEDDSEEIDLSGDDSEEIDLSDEDSDVIDLSEDDAEEFDISDLSATDSGEIDLAFGEDDLAPAEVFIDEDSVETSVDETMVIDTDDISIDDAISLDQEEAIDETKHLDISGISELNNDEVTEFLESESEEPEAEASVSEDTDVVAVDQSLVDEPLGSDTTEDSANEVDPEATIVFNLGDELDLSNQDVAIPDIDMSDDDFLDSEDITDINNIEELMLPDDVDEVATKLDLAKAFIDMGDSEGAKSSLEEVMQDGSDEQKSEAEDLLKQI